MVAPTQMVVPPRSLTLAVDAIGTKHSGGATVLTAIVSAALASAEIGRVVLFASPRNTWKFTLPADSRLTVVERPLEDRSYLARILWFEYGLARAAQQHGANVLLTLGAGGRPPRNVPAVAFLQQSAPFLPMSLVNQGFQTTLRFAVLKQTIGRSARASQRVIVQTWAFGEALMSAFGLERSRLCVITPSAPELPPPPECPPKFLKVLWDAPKGLRFLYVGNNAPYKNIDVAVRGVQKLNHLGVPARLFLTFECRSRARIEAPIVYLGSLTRQELAAAYAAADLLVMPSLTESLGLPLLEGMSVGVPILAADRPYAREVTAGQAEYFDPLDSDSFVTHCKAVLENRELTQARVFMARRHVAQLRELNPYDELIRVVLSTVSV